MLAVSLRCAGPTGAPALRASYHVNWKGERVHRLGDAPEASSHYLLKQDRKTYTETDQYNTRRYST